MTIVVDFAWAKPSAAQLKQWGAVAAGMYTSHDSSKNATRAIVDSYAAAGIKSFLFFEDTANRALGGYAAGAADAKFAYGQAASYGKPKWAPVIPAADFDVPDYAPTSSSPMAKLGPVGKYFQAWHDYNVTQGVIADAAYGDYYLIKRLTAARLCQLAVQTIAWSGGQVDLAGIVLYQNAQLLGSSTDVEIIENTALLSHLAWVPGQPSPAPLPLPAAPVPVEEDIMQGSLEYNVTHSVLIPQSGPRHTLLNLWVDYASAANPVTVRVALHMAGKVGLEPVQTVTLADTTWHRVPLPDGCDGVSMTQETQGSPVGWLC